MKKLRIQEAKKPEAALIFVFALAVTVLLIAGCDPANQDTFKEMTVLQGQLYVGHAPEIRLTRSIPLEAYYDPHTNGVSGATVELTAGDRTFNLEEKLSDPRGNGYYGLAASDTHTVTPGMRYSIRCISGTDTLTAQTRAAGFIHITQQNHDTVMVNKDSLVLHWPLDSLARGYWLIYENINPHRGDDSCWLGLNNQGTEKNLGVWESYWNVPPMADSTNSPMILFHWSGEHRVRIFSCDSALWYYSNTFQPRQTTIEPVTNVHGGLGIFCAGGVDTTYFYMAKDPNLHD